MLKIGLVLVSGIVATIITLWPKSPAVTATPTAQSISILRAAYARAPEPANAAYR